jgi:hypothetical protein
MSFKLAAEVSLSSLTIFFTLAWLCGFLGGYGLLIVTLWPQTLAAQVGIVWVWGEASIRCCAQSTLMSCHDKKKKNSEKEWLNTEGDE